MKNLKKVLSLVLALALALSLMTTAFGAVTKASSLTGYDKVGTTYTQAVDAMVALGVIDGVSGDIQAQGNVTREQAAKIICTMLMGSNASSLSTTSKYFSDVPTTRWSAPYIAYCVEKGIVSGVGGGKFNPTGNVTGNQFAKMLLVALGYNASTEGYTGTNWAVNVSSDAADAGIYKNATALDKNTAATREQACLYAWNTINATMVKYASTGTNITIGNTNINVGGSTAEAVTSSEDYSKNLKGWNTGATSGTVEFGEKYFSTLKKTSANSDVFGRPASQYKVGTTTVGTYANTATVTYTKPVTLGTIYNDLGLSASMTTTAVTLDGVAQSNVILSKGNAAYLASAGNGVDTEVFYDSDANTVKIVCIKTYAAKVTSVTAATASANRYVTIDTMNFETANFAAGDLVTYTMANGAIQSVKALSKAATGALTSYTSTKAATIGGTTYSANATFADANNIEATNYLKANVDVYTDDYGYMIYLNATTTTVNYAVVVGLGTTNIYGSSNYGCTLVLADGSTVTGYYNSLKSTGLTGTQGGSLNAFDIVSYTTDTNGVYTLTVVGNYATSQDVAFTNGKPAITLGTETGKHANSNTVYIVRSGSTTYTYTSYKGYASAPSMAATGAAGVSYVPNAKDSTLIDMVYIDTATVSTSTSNIYVVKAGTVYNPLVTDSTGTYRTVNAVVNGEVTTLKFADTAAGYTKLKTGDNLLASVTQDANGIVTDFVAATTNRVLNGTGTKAYAGDVITLAGTALSCATDVKVYTVSAAGAIAVSALDAIATDVDDNVTYTTNTSGKVTAIYITSVATKYALTYTNTYGKVYSDSACTTEVATGTNVAQGTTLYVKAVTMNKALTISGVSAVQVTAPAATLYAVYSFVMPNAATTITITEA